MSSLTFLLPMGPKQPLLKSLGTKPWSGPTHDGVNAVAASFLILALRIRKALFHLLSFSPLIHLFLLSLSSSVNTSPLSLRPADDFNALPPQTHSGRSSTVWGAGLRALPNWGLCPSPSRGYLFRQLSLGQLTEQGQPPPCSCLPTVHDSLPRFCFLNLRRVYWAFRYVRDSATYFHASFHLICPKRRWAQLS